MNIKSGKQVASRFPKNDSRYWLEKVFKPINGAGETGPHYCLRIQFKGKRVAFSTGTGNKDAAAKIARDIYQCLIEKGLEATLVKWRASKPEESPTEVGTVGEYISAAKSVSTVAEATFGSYVRCLRSIVADIVGVKKSKKRFHHGNAVGYRGEMDKTSLSVLTPAAIQEWRVRFVKKASNNPAVQKSARISCNSVLIQSRSLFGKKVARYITGIKLPDPLPFSQVELYPKESMRYQSKIDGPELIQAALHDLEKADPDVLKVFLLAFGAGLRKNEIDKLMISQIDFERCQISVEVTKHAKLKNLNSDGVVEMDQALCSLLQVLCASTKGAFVIEGDDTVRPDASYGKLYRSETVFRRVYTWLRAHGVEGRKPIQTLRKEAGSMICNQFGIYAASRFLRHADTQVTVQHYVDIKEKVSVNIGAMLKKVDSETSGVNEVDSIDLNRADTPVLPRSPKRKLRITKG